MSRPQKRRLVARPQPLPVKRQDRNEGRPGATAAAVVVATVLVIGTLVVLKSAEPGPVVVERDPTVVAAGEGLFSASCAVCHGADLKGTDTGPPLLFPTYAPNHHGDEAFQQAVALGVPPHHWTFGPMPPVAGLSRDDVAMIVAYVRTAQESEGIFIDPTH